MINNRFLKKRGLILLICLISLTMNCKDVFSQNDFILQSFACNGEIRISSGNKTRIISGKYPFGNVQQGMQYKDDFFAIDTNSLGESTLRCTNLKSMQTRDLLDLTHVVERNFIPWEIGYADDQLIIFSAYMYDNSVEIKKQKRRIILYQFEQDTKKTRKMPITDCNRTEFSYSKGRVYYTSSNGTICECVDSQNHSLGVKGICPIISTDSSKIAYISYGFLGEGVYIYDLRTKEKTSIVNFFGHNSILPTIRWSNDSKLIAIKRKSDLFPQPLYVVNILTKKIVSKLRDAHVCNWFFINSS